MTMAERVIYLNRLAKALDVEVQELEKRREVLGIEIVRRSGGRRGVTASDAERLKESFLAGKKGSN